VIRAIRQWLNRWAARRLSAVAHEQRLSDRERIRKQARELREQLGLPPLSILNHEGNHA